MKLYGWYNMMHTIEDGVTGMNQEEYVNNKYEYLCQKLLVPAFRNICLKFGHKTTIFYDFVQRATFMTDMVTLGGEKQLSAGMRVTDDRRSETRKNSERLRKIIDRLTPNADGIPEEVESEKVFFVAKEFDYQLYRSMARSYQCLAAYTGDDILLNAPEGQLAKSVSIMDRNGFSFVELATIACIFLAIQGRSIKKINSPVLTENERKRAVPRLKKMAKILKSMEFRDCLLMLLIDLVGEYHEKEQGDLVYRHLRDFFLPEDKRSLKTAKYAVEHFGHKIQPGSGITEEEWASIDNSTIQRFLQENDTISLTQWFFFMIVPVADAIAGGIIPEEAVDALVEQQEVIDIREVLLNSDRLTFDLRLHLNNSSSENYRIEVEDLIISRKVANAFTAYLDAVCREVLTLLSCLPEMKIFSTEELERLFQ
ncbi:MAG: hypothetical protein IKT52_06425 [Oscillospiraceae bacterium]|nr:hypothetical protein [Oscillospiraceae bacterium]